MKIVNGTEYFTVGEVGQKIGRTPQTIINWYNWKDEFGNKHDLPEPRRDLDKLRRRFFTGADIVLLEAFRDSIQYGDLAEYNRSKWGKRNPEKS